MNGSARAVLAQVVLVMLAEMAAAVPPLPCDTNAGACWTPPLQARWQYQLEVKRNRYVDTGGINVDICMRPFTGGACVTPEVFDIDLYVDSNLTGEGVFVVNTAAIEAPRASRRASRARSRWARSQSTSSSRCSACG